MINLPVRWRSAAALPMVVGALLLAGCGGSSAPRKFPGGIKPIGPADLATNVTGLMASNQPQLKHVKMACPAGPVTHFPVRCRFTATQVAQIGGTSKKQSFPGPYRVAGTVNVFGVYFRTRTYEYGLNFAPTH